MLQLINDNGIAVKQYNEFTERTLRSALLFMKRSGKNLRILCDGIDLPFDRDDIPFKRLYQLTGACTPGYWITISDQWEELFILAERIVKREEGIEEPQKDIVGG